MPGEVRSNTIIWLCGIAANKLGGFERHCLETVRQAAARGCDMLFVFTGPPSDEIARLIVASGARWTVVPQLDALGWRASARLFRLIARERAILLHLHLCSLYRPFFVLAGALGVPIIATYHFSGAPSPPGTVKNLVKRLRRKLFRGSLRAVTAVSNSAREKLAVDYLVPHHDIRVIYNGTDASAISTETARLPTGLLFAGALIPEKGVAVALAALRFLRESGVAATLTIAGDGPDRPRLIERSRALDLVGNVEFLGLRDDVPALMQRYPIVVVPSVWDEAFGLVIIEAMAAGCVVVASRIGGIPEIITHEVDGLLVPAGDAEALAGAVERLLREPALMSRLALQAVATVRKRFLLTGIVRQYFEVYEALGAPPEDALVKG